MHFWQLHHVINMEVAVLWFCHYLIIYFVRSALVLGSCFLHLTGLQMQQPYSVEMF